MVEAYSACTNHQKRQSAGFCQTVIRRVDKNICRPYQDGGKEKEKMMDVIVLALEKEINSTSEAKPIFDVQGWMFNVQGSLIFL